MPDAPSGWEREEPKGEMRTYEEGTWSIATTKYAKIPLRSDEPSHEVIVEIMDSVYYDVGLMAQWRKFTTNENYRTRNHIKEVTIRGLPAFLYVGGIGTDYAELWVRVTDRFIVKIVSTRYALTQYDYDIRKNTLDAFALNFVDYGGIGALCEDAAQPTETEHSAGQVAQTPTTSSKVGKTPGFESIFAIAGLLIVAHLIWYRKRK